MAGNLEVAKQDSCAIVYLKQEGVHNKLTNSNSQDLVPTRKLVNVIIGFKGERRGMGKDTNGYSDK